MGTTIPAITNGADNNLLGSQITPIVKNNIFNQTIVFKTYILLLHFNIYNKKNNIFINGDITPN